MVDLLLPAATALQSGGHVVFPTETVYGLCCNPFDEVAIRGIYEIKGRSFRNPLTLHISESRYTEAYVMGFDREAVRRLTSEFWPGPLTIVLPKSDNVPISLTGGLPTVGLRCPSDEVAKVFIDMCGGAVAGTSANLSGNLASTQFGDLEEELSGRVDYILSADFVGGLESTVLDMSDGVKILRPGLISAEMIGEVLGFPAEICYDQIPTAETKKYALRAQLFLYDSKQLLEAIERHKGKKLGVVILKSDEAKANEADLREGYLLEQIEVECVERDRYAFLLYDILHRLDRTGVDVILAPRVEKRGIGAAIMHRLEKSAGLI